MVGRIESVRRYLVGLYAFWILAGWVCGFASLGWWIVLIGAIVWIFIRDQVSAVIICLGVGFLIGMAARGNLEAGRGYLQHGSGELMGRDIQVMGTIVREPRVEAGGVEYIVEIRGSGLVELRLPKWPEYEYGDFLEIEGRFDEPENFEGSDFDYVAYLERKNVFLTIFRPKVRKVGESGEFRSRFIRATFAIKKEITGVINRNLPEPEAALLSGILLGVQNTMPADFAEELRITGTTHIIAVSGYNMTVIVEFVRRFGKKTLGKWGDVLAVILVVWFGIMTGMSPPVLRAVISAILSIGGRGVGRPSEVFANTIVTILMMLLLDPNLFYSVSFLLSIAAVLGLIFWVPILKKWLWFIPESLEEGSIVTLSAVFATTPITSFYFGSVSLIAPVANFLVTPIVGGVMMLGFGGVLVGTIGEVFSLRGMSFWPSWALLDVFEQVVRGTARLKFLYFKIDSGSVWLLVMLLSV